MSEVANFRAKQTQVMMLLMLGLVGGVGIILLNLATLSFGLVGTPIDYGGVVILAALSLYSLFRVCAMSTDGYCRTLSRKEYDFPPLDEWKESLKERGELTVSTDLGHERD